MDVLTLPAQPRAELGKTVDRLRRRHLIPAVIYGHNLPSQTISVDERVFQRVYRQAGSSSLVDLVIGEQPPLKTLIQAIQRHPTTQHVTHVDFYQVKMGEKITADIELRFVGESSAVKEQGGVFVRARDAVKVECLPGDLVPSIDVDISVLKKFDDRLHVSDLTVPSGITLLEKTDEVVASVTPPRSEEELAALSEKVEENVEAVKVEEKEKAADEEEAPSDETATTVPTT